MGGCSVGTVGGGTLGQRSEKPHPPPEGALSPGSTGLAER